MASKRDAVVVGSGPNGLAAAIELALNGFEVAVLEARDTIGGGMRTRELTLPGFRHDECSAIHPLGLLSPFFRTLPLAEHGLEWIQFPASVAHPLDDGPAPILYQSLERTAERLGPDGPRWRRRMEPFLRHPPDLLADLLGPLRLNAEPPALPVLGLDATRRRRARHVRLPRRPRGDAPAAPMIGRSVQRGHGPVRPSTAGKSSMPMPSRRWRRPLLSGDQRIPRAKPAEAIEIPISRQEFVNAVELA